MSPPRVAQCTNSFFVAGLTEDEWCRLFTAATIAQIGESVGLRIPAAFLKCAEFLSIFLSNQFETGCGLTLRRMV